MDAFTVDDSDEKQQQWWAFSRQVTSHQNRTQWGSSVKSQCPSWKLCKIFIGNKIVYCHCQTHNTEIEVPKLSLVRVLSLSLSFVLFAYFEWFGCCRHCWFLYVFWFMENLIMHRWAFVWHRCTTALLLPSCYIHTRNE